MSDALGIEMNDIDGVIRPISTGDKVDQEIVLYDSVPGGAGHVLRLRNQDELVRVLEHALARVANCKCDPSASCYGCLRHYRNQYCHDLLVRQLPATYLVRLLDGLRVNPDQDQAYLWPDKANALQSAILHARAVWWVADDLTLLGPLETRPWYLLLQEAATKQATVRLALRQMPSASADFNDRVAPLALQQAGVKLYQVNDGATPPPYGLLTIQRDESRIAYRWGDPPRLVVLDEQTHLQPLWINRSQKALQGADSMFEKWLGANTRALTVAELYPAAHGYKLHTVPKDGMVKYGTIFEAVAPYKVVRVELQDPYLLSRHQIGLLGKFLAEIPWKSARAKIPFKLVIYQSEDDGSSPGYPSSVEQRTQIMAEFAKHPMLDLGYNARYKRQRSIHIRYAYFQLEGGKEILYTLERGLDMVDEKTGKGRADSYVLEFSPIPVELKRLLRIL
jgi:hypothetical protein